MNRNFFRFWLIVLLVGPGYTLALEIDEIQVQSALNQLFDARIPLPALTPEELAKVSVKLAPSSMFKEFGLERASTLANLVFAIEYNAAGQVYVRVVSTKPIREPSLALLLEFTWPRGKTFREFTVFLDPIQRLAKRPSNRSKTVLETPPLAAVPVKLAPVVVAAIPETESIAPPSDSSVTESAPITVAEAPASSPLSAAAPSEPVRLYRPGDTYGPVAVGEGLWGIALKVRPDPGITYDEMMQALFQANPQAFSKSGVDGLKAGAVLRIPTLREIADFTDSPVARQLAGADQPVAVPSTVTVDRAGHNETASVSSGPALTEQTNSGSPEIFPLPLPDPLEPTVVVAPALMPRAETPQPLSEPVHLQPEPATTVPESVALLSESVTPLLSLVVADMIATADSGVSAVIPAQKISVLPMNEPAVPEPSSEWAMMPSSVAEPVAAVVVQVAPVHSSDQAMPDAPKPLPVAIDAMGFLAEMEQRIPRSVLESLPPIQAGDLSMSTLLMSKPAVPELVPELVAMQTAPVHSSDQVMPDTPKPLPVAIDAMGFLAEMEQRIPRSVLESLPPIQASKPSVMPTAPPTEPLSPTEQAVAPPSPETTLAPLVEPSVSVNREYGPVVANERLWDIATRTRPDPGISKDHMMRSLFKANPQAFSKPDNMDSLKVGVMLRIPSVQEIVEYTDSRVAKEMLKQQQPAVETPVAQVPAAASNQRQ